MGIWQTGDLYVGAIGEFSSGTDRVRPVSHTLGVRWLASAILTKPLSPDRATKFRNHESQICGLSILRPDMLWFSARTLTCSGSAGRKSADLVQRDRLAAPIVEVDGQG